MTYFNILKYIQLIPLKKGLKDYSALIILEDKNFTVFMVCNLNYSSAKLVLNVLRRG